MWNAGYVPCTENLVGVLNPNTLKSYKISQKLSPKHAARGVAQSPTLSKQPPRHAAGGPHPGGGGHSNMKVTYKCLPENENRGHSV